MVLPRQDLVHPHLFFERDAHGGLDGLQEGRRAPIFPGFNIIDDIYVPPRDLSSQLYLPRDLSGTLRW